MTPRFQKGIEMTKAPAIKAPPVKSNAAPIIPAAIAPPAMGDNQGPVMLDKAETWKDLQASVTSLNEATVTAKNVGARTETMYLAFVRHAAADAGYNPEAFLTFYMGAEKVKSMSEDSKSSRVSEWRAIAVAARNPAVFPRLMEKDAWKNAGGVRGFLAACRYLPTNPTATADEIKTATAKPPTDGDHLATLQRGFNGLSDEMLERYRPLGILNLIAQLKLDVDSGAFPTRAQVGKSKPKTGKADAMTRLMANGEKEGATVN